MTPDASEIYTSEIGDLEIASFEGKIISCTFSALYSASNLTPNPTTNEACKQLQAYFNGSLKKFDLTLAYVGSDLQLRLMKMLEAIPYGETFSYQDMAKRLELTSGSRAVGNLVGKNPLLIIIPCHRVLGSDGKITGYAGGPDRKKWLLQHELRFSHRAGTLF